MFEVALLAASLVVGQLKEQSHVRSSASCRQPRRRMDSTNSRLRILSLTSSSLGAL